jgi:hypothetical protein
LSNVNPVAAAVQPEYEFSMDTTTGMSDPPIGKINVKPRISEKITKQQNKSCDGDTINVQSITMQIQKIIEFIKFVFRNAIIGIP